MKGDSQYGCNIIQDFPALTSVQVDSISGKSKWRADPSLLATGGGAVRDSEGIYSSICVGRGNKLGGGSELVWLN